MAASPAMIEGLRTLLAAAQAEWPAGGVGLIYRDDSPGLVFAYMDGTGLSAYRAEEAEIGPPFRPGAVPADISEEELLADRSGLIQSRVMNIHLASDLPADSWARRILTAPANGGAATFLLGLGDPRPARPPDATTVLELARRSDACFTATESEASEMAVLRRLDLAERKLPKLFSVLDVREIFDRLSESTRDVLPHDIASLGVFNDDLTRIEVYAQTAADAFPRGGIVPFPAVQTRTWLYRLIDDVTLHPMDKSSDAARAGGRATLRVAARLDGRTIGSLSFTTRSRRPYDSADLRVATRLADYVSLALSHYRLADESRRTAALRERAANLEMLDGLLNTITGVLDIRQVFDRVSAIADKVLPHDALSIAEMLGTDVVRIHASHGLGNLPEPFDIPMPDANLTTEPWDYRIVEVDDRPEYAHGPGAAAGMRSALFVSIRFEGRLFGGLNFYSRTKGRYTPDDVLLARRITDHVALALSHRRLAEQDRQNEELRARATTVELLEELLATLVETGGIRDAFERISEIAQKVLVHDAMALMVRLDDGIHARVYARSGLPRQMPEVTQVPPELLTNPDWEYDIYDDVRNRGEYYSALSAMGLLSLVRVPVRLDGRFAGALLFFSKKTAAFKQSDVMVARRMADRLAVVLTRDRETQATIRADEATARASKLEARVQALTEELDNRTGYRRVVGESAQWRAALKQATQVAATEATVLLLGESGTGKEVIARFIHRASSRTNGPFVALNCAALPEQLLEAELFGYERGAYTGATQSKPGQLEQAGGGTLFLDEVGEMSPTSQAKFLRVLQEREFQRLGGTRVLRTDARIVAATNRDLKKAIEQGQFREDLYYRLNVFAIQLPALRERPDDILPLSEAFLIEICKGLGRPPGGISRDARGLLKSYQWPGNVRELRNILERAAILCEGGLITPEHLAIAPPAVAPAAPPPSPPPSRTQAAAPPAGSPASVDQLQSIERRMIEEALHGARFNKSKAAKTLGLTRQQLYVRMRKFGLE